MGALILAGDDHTGRQVGDTDCRVRGVDGLAAMTAGAKNVDAQVFRFDRDVHFFSLRQHGDGNGAGVHAAGLFGLGGALNAVRTALIL